MLKSLFARIVSFAKWLLAAEVLGDLPPESPPVERKERKRFPEWLLAKEDLPEFQPAVVTATRERGFFRYLFARETLGKDEPPDASSRRSSFFCWLFSLEELDCGTDYDGGTDLNSRKQG